MTNYCSEIILYTSTSGRDDFSFVDSGYSIINGLEALINPLTKQNQQQRDELQWQKTLINNLDDELNTLKNQNA